jgi:hypothetical protein
MRPRSDAAGLLKGVVLLDVESALAGGRRGDAGGSPADAPPLAASCAARAAHTHAAAAHTAGWRRLMSDHNLHFFPISPNFYIF